MPLFSTKKIRDLPTAHREALQWFHEKQGQEVPWPAPMASGMFLVNKAKGIHKPAGSAYALSIRESLGGPYPDREPQFMSDGSWTYDYFQERLDTSEGRSEYTNVALEACQLDEIPVGVIRQVKAKPNPRYKVLGLAFVRRWENGFFKLEGIGNARPSSFLGNGATNHNSDTFDPKNIEDARKKVLAEIVCRQGQGKFRSSVLEAYGGRCAISNCDVHAALEAAHIFGYMGKETNVVNNGLLLRADLHILFDLGKITINPALMSVSISPTLYGTAYEYLAGLNVRMPVGLQDRPSHVALEKHWTWAKARWVEDDECSTSLLSSV